MDQINVIIRDDNYIKIQAPLSFAYDYAQRGLHVEVLFLNLAVRVLTAEGAQALSVDGKHSVEEPWLRERLAAVGVPTDVHEFLRAVVSAGDVSLKGCQDSAAVLNISEEELIPEAYGLVDSSEFIQKAVDAGVHCMYF